MKRLKTPNCHRRLGLSWLLCLLGAFTAELRTVSAQEDPRLKQIFADWEVRRNSLKTLRYVIDGEYTWEKHGIMNPQADPEDRFYPDKKIVLKTHRKILLDYPRQRHRVESRDEQCNFATKKVTLEEWQNIFNGHEAKARNLSMRQDNPKQAGIGIVKGEQRFTFIDTFGSPLHLAHGNVPWNQAHPGKLKFAPEHDLYSVAGETMFEKRRCIVVREAKRRGRVVDATEYWVDPARNSIVLRMIERLGKRVLNDLSIQYAQTDVGWLPVSWTFTNFNEWVDRLKSISRQRVTSRTLYDTVADSEFDLVPEPGELITERTNKDGKMWKAWDMPEATYHRVDESGRLVPVTIEDGVERPKRRLWIAVVVGLSAIVALMLGYYLFRRARRRSSADKTCALG